MPELTVPDLPGAYEQHRFLKEKLERTEKALRELMEKVSYTPEGFLTINSGAAAHLAYEQAKAVLKGASP